MGNCVVKGDNHAGNNVLYFGRSTLKVRGVEVFIKEEGMSAMLLCAEKEMHSSIDKNAEAASRASDPTFLACWQVQKNVHSPGNVFLHFECTQTPSHDIYQLFFMN